MYFKDKIMISCLFLSQLFSHFLFTLLLLCAHTHTPLTESLFFIRPPSSEIFFSLFISSLVSCHIRKYGRLLLPKTSTKKHFLLFLNYSLPAQSNLYDSERILSVKNDLWVIVRMKNLFRSMLKHITVVDAIFH